MIKERCMTFRGATVLVGVGLLFAGLVIPVANAQQASGPVKVVQLTGLAGVKDNAKGTLSVENGQLHFVHGKASSEVSAASIQDVVTGAIPKNRRRHDWRGEHGGALRRRPSPQFIPFENRHAHRSVSRR